MEPVVEMAAGLRRVVVGAVRITERRTRRLIEDRKAGMTGRAGKWVGGRRPQGLGGRDCRIDLLEPRVGGRRGAHGFPRQGRCRLAPIGGRRLRSLPWLGGVAAAALQLRERIALPDQAGQLGQGIAACRILRPAAGALARRTGSMDR